MQLHTDFQIQDPTQSVKGAAQTGAVQETAHLHLIVVTEARENPLSARQNTSSQGRQAIR
jgi:hypothetical protein